MAGEKLTKAQREMLAAAATGRIYPRRSRYRMAQALEDRGLLRISHVGISVGYTITEAGRAALSARGG